jgi:predicted nucleic acid-binding protein
MKYLLDSNILRAYLNQHPIVTFNLDDVADGDLFVASVVLAEQLRGRYDALCKAESQHLLRLEERLRATQIALQRFQILWLTPVAIAQLENLQSQVKTRKRYADAIQAALAWAEDAVVVTRNLSDFRDLLPAARLVNWFDRVH